MQGCTSNFTFRNWGQTITCKPESYCQPDTENDVVQIVQQAIVNNKRVRVVGAGHSWAPLVLTRDILINLDKLTRMLQLVMPGRRVKIEAGMRLKHLISRLRDDNLGLRNIGSITEQSIAGAISTGTHGTGLTLGSIGTQIIAVQLVTGTGDILTITEQDPDRLNAARLNLGALGIITQLTLQCVDDYELECATYWCKFDSIVDKMETLAQQNTRVKFWWLIPPIGAKDNVIMTTENPVGASASPASSVEGLPMDTIGILDNLSGAASEIHPFLKFTGKYDQVMTIPLLPVLHRECEYAIPVGKTAEALRAFKRAVEEQNLSLTLPLEVRFVAKDNTLLSPANQQDVSYIGVATQPNANEVIQRFEPIMKRLGGRPHWGKCFSLTRAEAEAMYPDYQKFRTIRNEFDPNRVFSNEFLKYFFD
ncbi:MAG TPA: D-arabinono-1,4-lactone oxidase [Acidobacteriota bacterium]|nr:D-arabinono-1,4-lactone oxidase [Acidobacteriota bacterium]